MTPLSPSADLGKGLAIVKSALQPAPDERLAIALSGLMMLCAYKAGDGANVRVTLEAYVGKLRKYPADVALAAIDKWSEKSKFWPTWFELREECEYFARDRAALLLAIEHDFKTAGLPPPPEPTEEERKEFVAKLKSLANLFRFGKQKDLEKAA